MSDIITLGMYVNLFGSQLENFKKKRDNTWSFRCPICGDSVKDKSKSRGYVYRKDGDLLFFCHNCGTGKKFIYLLKEYAPELYKEYLQNHLYTKLVRVAHDTGPTIKKHTWNIDTDQLIPVSSLNETHQAYQYLLNRHIHPFKFHQIFWTDSYSDIVTKSFPGKYDPKHIPSSGIVFKLYEYDILVGYQLRSIDPTVDKKYRFSTCIADEHRGLFESASTETDTRFVVEGCMDALSLPNAVAVLTSDLKCVKDPNAIYMNDQEPRNKSIIKQIDREIQLGYKVIMLPEKYQGKDPNNLLVDFGSEKDLEAFLLEHVYQGMKAKLKLTTWRK